MSKLSELNRIRDELSSGKIANSRRLIMAMTQRRLDKRQKLWLSRYAIDASLPEVAARLLVTSVRSPDKSLNSGSSDQEKVEYGRALIMLGMIDEAKQILVSVKDQSQKLHANCDLAWASFDHWDFECAQELLSQTLEAQSDPLAKLRATHYMGFCLAHLGDPDNQKNVTLAKQYLKDATEISQTLPERYSHLGKLHKQGIEINLLEIDFLLKDWSAFESRIRKLADQENLLNREMTYFRTSALIKLAELRHIKRRPSTLRELDKLQESLRKNGDIRTVRANELRICTLLNDRDRAVKLFFGSPYPKLRKLIQRRLGLNLDELPQHYSRLIGPKGASVKDLDVMNFPRNGILPQRMLAALASDFYDSFSPGRMFATIHPDKVYNPLSSPDCLWQIAQRLRGLLNSANIPLSLLLKNGKYQLHSSKGIKLMVPRDITTPQVPLDIQKEFERAKERFRDGHFNSSDYEQWLKVSRPTAVSRLNLAVANGWIKKIGSGSSTVYKFITS